MIKTVIFDIGNVLVHFRWRELYVELGYTGEKFERIADATVRNPWWEEFDKGLMTTEEVIDRFAERAPEYRTEISEIYEPKNLGELVRLYDYAIPWIQELKADGYRVYILSNWSKPAYDANLDTNLRFLSEVDGALMSFQEGIIKPDRKIYELICSRYDIDPKEAVFLDDNAANIEGARAFGLNAIHFKNYEQAKRELDAMLA
ncbi:MAG: HAD family phosphatase [Lachnospiraceae bacterium]|nr:HAD family phosphatase [Lachnospiraceae bacterium]